jgi:hypothetical protein
MGDDDRGHCASLVNLRIGVYYRPLAWVPFICSGPKADNRATS